jgi:hypothetical protein
VYVCVCVCVCVCMCAFLWCDASCCFTRTAVVFHEQLDAVPQGTLFVFVSKDVAVSKRQEERFSAAEYLPVIEIRLS